MFVADSTVWIDYFAEHDTWQTTSLAAAIDCDEVLVPNLVIVEVLQGVNSDKKYREIHDELCAYEYVDVATKPVVVKAAENYRALRKRGVTIRKTIDMIIATYCIAPSP